jgi:hypothetical protein
MKDTKESRPSKDSMTDSDVNAQSEAACTGPSGLDAILEMKEKKTPAPIPNREAISIITENEIFVFCNSLTEVTNYS